jgi:hypothetical protein
VSAETTDMAALYRDTLAAVLDALDIPYAAVDGDHDQQRQRLQDRRANEAAETVRAVLTFDDYPELIRQRVERLRVYVDRTPVRYRRYIGTAAEHPADCVVCGPGCCSPVVGVHDSCPGPLVGRTVASVR